MKINGYRMIGLCAICVASLIAFSGCPVNEKSPMGFRLPEGDIEKGKAAFISLGCIQCHLVDGEQSMPEPAGARKVFVTLGGEVKRVKTYGQLVTSIINPSHDIERKYRGQYVDDEGNSIMPDFSEKMTVREMIDIVEYLQAQYEVVIPDYPYDGYGPM